MKKILLFFLVLVSWLTIDNNIMAQDRQYSVYYYRRASLFEKLPIKHNDIVFLGNSITDGCEWNELFNNRRIKNRGISGDITKGVYDRLGTITKGKPAKIFLLIGINDLSRGISIDSIVGNIDMILCKIKQESPQTHIYLQSILPVSDQFNNYPKHSSQWSLVAKINDKLQIIAGKNQVTYVDLFSHFVDETGEKLSEKYTNDGLHLIGDGYMLWKSVIEKYI